MQKLKLLHKQKLRVQHQQERKKETSQLHHNIIDGKMATMSIDQKLHTITNNMVERIRDTMTLQETGDTAPTITDTINIKSQRRFQHHLRQRSVMSTPPSTIARI